MCKLTCVLLWRVFVGCEVGVEVVKEIEAENGRSSKKKQKPEPEKVIWLQNMQPVCVCVCLV